ncbi:SusC/RagA family TonB-linked outer membrane protein [Ohtaekwangia kribbensis]|jgi:TonB-linked SusC/RagA family outer membrane protein|uniref:SusC/RagA family TonB-linked outer membrane protein n=1 Tax=Ohtaekwangia kribbensis TaxID=688913 RepID=A0ABW3KBH9_9BACT
MIRKLLFTVLLHSLLLTTVWAQDRQVSGKVTAAEDGTSLPGVNIVVQGTTKGTTTDAEGNYTIQLGPSENTLVFTFVGFTTITETVGDRTVIDVVMGSDITSLGEVVVIGYGVAKKSDVTGAVATVKAEDLNKIPSSTAAEALQGKVAGVQVTTNGTPGSAPTIRVRGLGSVSSRVEPLYVVDGVLVDDISFLGSNDIESMNILKDASASAIYGIRASNGVVIIQTKRGKNEQPRIAYSGYGGVQTPINMVDMANGSQYIELLNEKDAIAASRNGTTFTPRDASAYPYSTDWYDEILRSGASIQSHDLSVTGGTEKSVYAMGGSFFKQEGLAGGTDYRRLNLRTNVESNVTKFLKIGVNANLSNFKSNNAPASLFTGAYIAPPAIPVRIDENTFASPQAFGDFANPAASQYYNNDKTKGIRLVGAVFADVTLMKGLTFKTAYGVDGSYSQNTKYVPPYFVSSTQRDTTKTLTRKIDNYFSYYWDNTLTYDFTVNSDHHFTLLAGMNAQQQQYYYMEGKRQGVDNFGENTWYFKLSESGNDGSITDDGYRIRAFSYFGRLSYAFREKYLLTATLRRDGTSVFEEGNRYDYFPSVGLGWVISNESFMDNQEIFQFLKVRASWGKMGNNRIPASTVVNYTSTGGAYSPVFGGTIQPGESITIIAPDNLLWEYTKEVDLAVEGYVLKNRLNFEIDYYNRKTSNAIFPVTVNGVFGTSNRDYLDNNADVVNRGVEVALNWKDEVGDFKYGIGGVFAYNQNKVDALKPGTVGIYGGYVNVTPTTYTVVGHSVGEFYGRKVIGIFQNTSEIESYTSSNGTVIQPNAKPGDFKYQDSNDDGQISDKDRVFLGSAIPKYNFGINLYGAYKGFDITIDLYAQGGNKIYNAKRYRQIGNENYDLDFYENRWHGEGTSNSYPSADLSADANKQANSWYLESGNFFKVRNIQIGYTIPAETTSRIGISKIRIYANAANPLVSFKYNGFSPEIPTAVPGVNQQNTTNITSQGIDNNVYPMAATYNFGVNISL